MTGVPTEANGNRRLPALPPSGRWILQQFQRNASTGFYRIFHLPGRSNTAISGSFSQCFARPCKRRGFVVKCFLAILPCSFCLDHRPPHNPLVAGSSPAGPTFLIPSQLVAIGRNSLHRKGVATDGVNPTFPLRSLSHSQEVSPGITSGYMLGAMSSSAVRCSGRLHGRRFLLTARRQERRQPLDGAGQVVQPGVGVDVHRQADVAVTGQLLRELG